jgi:divalent metal cation (Fe/Co/Zn/Cd) transporter
MLLRHGVVWVWGAKNSVRARRNLQFAGGTRFLAPHRLAAAGVIDFVGNEIAAQIRLRAGERLSSPALVADGNHARTDGFVSLGVLTSAGLVALGAQVADPIIGLIITLVILRITWQSWRTVSTTEPGEMIDPHEH